MCINLFISYNAWFKRVTAQNTDRAAINALKTRNVIWDEYTLGKTFYGLRPKLQKISDLTLSQPLVNLTGGNRHWDGIVKSADDWQEAQQEYEDVHSQYAQLSQAFRDAFDLWNVDMEDSYGR